MGHFLVFFGTRRLRSNVREKPPINSLLAGGIGKNPVAI